MSIGNKIGIGVAVLIVAVWLIVRTVMKKAIDKTADAIHNAKVRAQEQNPPRVENLADKYDNNVHTPKK